jgi:hypothetical protein
VGLAGAHWCPVKMLGTVGGALILREILPARHVIDMGLSWVIFSCSHQHHQTMCLRKPRG